MDQQLWSVMSQEISMVSVIKNSDYEIDKIYKEKLRLMDMFLKKKLLSDNRVEAKVYEKNYYCNSYINHTFYGIIYWMHRY